VLYLLSLHLDVQEKLQAEIHQARQAHGGNDLDFDSMDDLPYLDAVVKETLRLHPPATTQVRT
jgi:cytochrome P450